MIEINTPIIMAGAVISGVSILFFSRSKIGAITLSMVDLMVGLTLIGSKELVSALPLPEKAFMFLGIAILIKGIYYLVLSLR